MAEHITNSPKISKEPWEMTEKEFESLPWEATEKYVRIYWHGGLRMKRVPFHRVFVKEALEEGKPVPEKVLKDYPELKKKYTQHFKGGNNPMAEPFLDKSLERLGYKWVKESPDEVGKAIAGMLKTRNAKCYVMDVYTRDQVYRNLSCSWAGPQGLIERILQIRFNRDTGSDFQVTLETKEISEKEKYLT